MTLNRYAVAPWVLSVGATTVSGLRAPFSSGGLEFDATGLYHPDVMAPGDGIVSSGTPTGIGRPPIPSVPQEPGGTTTMAGTSMAAPHVAGAVALLRQARPDLSPAEMTAVLSATARPLKDGSPFWHAGYGMIDVAEALNLVTAPDYSPARAAAGLAAAADRVRAQQQRDVVRTDFATAPTAPVSVAGSDVITIPFEASETTDAVRLMVRHPSDDWSGADDFTYRLTVRDAAGAVVATGSSEIFAGVIRAFIDRRRTDRPATAAGRWTATLKGQLSVAEGALALPEVLMAVAELRHNGRPGPGPSFEPTGALSWSLAGGPADNQVKTPGGCSLDANPSDGALADGASSTCQASTHAYVWSTGSDPAVFTSQPLTQAATIGGTAKLSIAAAEPTQPTTNVVAAPLLLWSLKDQSGNVLAQGRPTLQTGVDAVRNNLDLPIASTPLPAGTVLRLELRPASTTATQTRLLYGGSFPATFSVPTGIVTP